MLRFRSSGVLQWSTYYGGNGSSTAQYDDLGIDVAVDYSENPYFLVRTFSNNLPVNDYGGLWDVGNYNALPNQTPTAHFTMFHNNNLSQQWAGHLRGANGNYGEAIDVMSNNQYLYLVGKTNLPQNGNNGLHTRDTTALNPQPSNNSHHWMKCESSSPGFWDGMIFRWTITAAPVGINDIERNWNDFYLYPNPATNEVTIQFEGQGDEPVFIRIFDSVGQLVYESRERGMHNGFSKKLNVEQLSSGMYLIQVVQGNWGATQKMIKQK